MWLVVLVATAFCIPLMGSIVNIGCRDIPVPYPTLCSCHLHSQLIRNKLISEIHGLFNNENTEKT
jgi:hypothetical protein